MYKISFDGAQSIISVRQEREESREERQFRKVSFEFRSKRRTEVVVRAAAGSEFHILGAATENARLPVDVLVLGMKRAESLG